MSIQFRIPRIWLAGAVSLLLVSVALGKMTENIVTGTVIQPARVHEGESFTFALAGSASGEVVEIRTVSGEVVSSAKTDNHGRVFLPAGLAAGTYAIIAGGGSKASGTIEVQAMRNSVVQPESVMRLTDTPRNIDLSKPLHLSGEGFSPNAANMTVGNTTVLAATRNELICAPLQQKPGITELMVTNSETGESLKSDPVLAYSLTGHIEQRTLGGGQQTQLRFLFQPPNVPAEVDARVISGPVSFRPGVQTARTTIYNGEGSLPVVANPTGVGPFTVSWALNTDDDPDTPQEWVQEKATACASASQLTENSQNEKDLAKEAKTDDELANNKDYWDEKGQPNDKDKLKDFLNAEIARLKKIARKEGQGNAKDKIADAIDAAYKAGKAAGLKLDDK